MLLPRDLAVLCYLMPQAIIIMSATFYLEQIKLSSYRTLRSVFLFSNNHSHQTGTHTPVSLDWINDWYYPDAPGTYLSGSQYMRSHTTFRVETGATLLGSSIYSDYPFALHPSVLHPDSTLPPSGPSRSLHRESLIAGARCQEMNGTVCTRSVFYKILNQIKYTHIGWLSVFNSTAYIYTYTHIGWLKYQFGGSLGFRF